MMQHPIRTRKSINRTTFFSHPLELFFTRAGIPPRHGGSEHAAPICDSMFWFEEYREFSAGHGDYYHRRESRLIQAVMPTEHEDVWSKFVDSPQEDGLEQALQETHLPEPLNDEVRTVTWRVIFEADKELGYEDLIAVLVDLSDQNAPNQAIVISRSVTEAKREYLEELQKAEILENFTVDSPVPFSIEKVLAKLKHLNTERVPGAREGVSKASSMGSSADSLPGK